MLNAPASRLVSWAHAVLIHNGLSVPVRDWRRRRHDWFVRGHQRGQIFRDDLPHDVFVNAEVIVDHLVAHANDVRPWDLRVLLREFSGRLQRNRNHFLMFFTDEPHAPRRTQSSLSGLPTYAQEMPLVRTNYHEPTNKTLIAGCLRMVVIHRQPTIELPIAIDDHGRVGSVRATCAVR